MGFIPKGARWYLADVVMEHRIDGESKNVVHVNTHLVKANSPDEAHEKALELGQAGEQEFENTEGRTVRIAFRGLRELNVIHEPLKDGAEIMYTEEVGVSEERLQKWVRPRKLLSVFAPITEKTGPNYMPKMIMEMLRTADFGRENKKNRSKVRRRSKRRPKS